MNRAYPLSFYDCIKSYILHLVDETILWPGNAVDCAPSFAGMVSVYSVYTDRTAKILKANATVTYPGHLVLLDVLKMFLRFLIHHGHTLVAFLPVAATKKITAPENKNAALK